MTVSDHESGSSAFGFYIITDTRNPKRIPITDPFGGLKRIGIIFFAQILPTLATSNPTGCNILIIFVLVYKLEVVLNQVELPSATPPAPQDFRISLSTVLVGNTTKMLP